MQQQYSSSMASPAKRPRMDSDAAAAPGIALMLIDAEEESNGTLLLWGLAAESKDRGSKHQTVLLRCPDYQPYFFIPCPHVVNPDTQELQEPQQQDLQRLRRVINSRCALVYFQSHSTTQCTSAVRCCASLVASACTAVTATWAQLLPATMANST